MSWKGEAVGGWPAARGGGCWGGHFQARSRSVRARVFVLVPGTWRSVRGMSTLRQNFIESEFGPERPDLQ